MKNRLYVLLTVASLVFVSLGASSDVPCEVIAIAMMENHKYNAIVTARDVEQSHADIEIDNVLRIQAQNKVDTIKAEFAHKKSERDPVRQRLLDYSTELSTPAEDNNINIATIQSILARTRTIYETPGRLNLSTIFEHNTILVSMDEGKGITGDFRQFNCCHCCCQILCSDIWGGYTYDYCCEKPDTPTNQEVLDFMRLFKSRIDISIASLNSEERKEIREAADQGVIIGQEVSGVVQSERVNQSQIIDRDSRM